MTASRRLGKYEILEEVGRGGFAVVYKARDTTLNRIVALKILHPQLTIDPKFVQRFHQEAQTAAGLHHPHIVTIHEVGQEAGQHYLAMTFLPGRTLDGRLTATRGLLPVELAISIVEQIADALDVIHQRGLVHRDVKPANIMVDKRGWVTLLDFGIVRAAEGTRLTTTMAVLGTPEYMAPEQAELLESVGVDWRADIYALGVVAYEMLVGRPPFTGKSPTAILYKHVYEPPPAPTTLNAGLPAGLEPVLLKALAKERKDRFQRAGDFAIELRRALSGGQVHPREAQLRPLYQQLQAAAATGDWRGVLALGKQIQALDAGYRDVAQQMAYAQGQLRQPRRAPAESTPQPQPARAASGVQVTARVPKQTISRRRFLQGALIVGASVIGCGAAAAVAALAASKGWLSCDGPSTEEPTQIPKPTDVSTDTPTPTGMPTPTATPTPTGMPTPTNTPTPTPTDTLTPTYTPTPTAIRLSPTQLGAVSSSGEVMSGLPFVGDHAGNEGMQSFFTFDVSAIPDSATIQEARLYYFTSSEWNLGAPFDDLGSLRVYHHNYGDLSADDYTIIPTFAEDTSILTIHSKAAWLDQPKSLNSRGVAALQDSLASDLFGIRIQFSEETDGDGEADHIVTTVELGVTYRL